VLAAAQRVPEAKAVVTIAAPSDPHYVVDSLFSEHLDTIASWARRACAWPAAISISASTSSRTRPGHQVHECIANLGRALLVMHAPQDDTVSMDNAGRIFELARHPKSFVSLDGIDHLITGRDDAAYVAGIIAAWSTRYLA
jgi:fermentation-respiration switch protein FrsA (DUF1100 family)